MNERETGFLKETMILNENKEDKEEERNEEQEDKDEEVVVEEEVQIPDKCGWEDDEEGDLSDVATEVSSDELLDVFPRSDIRNDRPDQNVEITRHERTENMDNSGDSTGGVGFEEMVPRRGEESGDVLSRELHVSIDQTGNLDQDMVSFVHENLKSFRVSDSEKSFWHQGKQDETVTNALGVAFSHGKSKGLDENNSVGELHTLESEKLQQNNVRAAYDGHGDEEGIFHKREEEEILDAELDEAHEPLESPVEAVARSEEFPSTYSEKVYFGDGDQEQSSNSTEGLLSKNYMRVGSPVDDEDSGIGGRFEDYEHLSDKDMLLAHFISQLDILKSGDKRGSNGIESNSRNQYCDHQGIAINKLENLGCLLAARAYLAPQFEPIFKPPTESPRIKAGSPSKKIVPESLTVISKYKGVVAVGSIDGSVKVVMQPSESQMAHVLSTAFDRSCVDNPVTAIAIGNHFSGLLMAVGHKSGLLNLWEMRSSSSNAMPTFTWHLSKSIQGTHASAITALVLIEMSATNFALAADAYGRLVCHNLNRHLSVAAQALAGLARQFSSVGMANASRIVELEALGQDPGTIVSMSVLSSPLNAEKLPFENVKPHRASQANDKSWDSKIGDEKHSRTLPGIAALSEPIILIVASRAVMICSFTMERMLSVLHLFLPPRSLLGVSDGYGAFRIETRWEALHFQDSIHERSTFLTDYLCAIVAVTWGQRIILYRVPVAPQCRNVALSASRASQIFETNSSHLPVDKTLDCTSLPSPELLASLNIGKNIIGVGFLAAGTLAVIVTSEDSITATEAVLIRPSTFVRMANMTSSTSRELERSESNPPSVRVEDLGIEEVEIIHLSDSIIGRQLNIPEDPSHHCALVADEESALLLTSRGIRILHLLSWNERLSSLISLGRLMDALFSAARLSAGVQDYSKWNDILLPSSGYWPADLPPPNQELAVYKQFLSILYAVLDYFGLQAIEGNPRTSCLDRDKARALADVAIDACMLISRQDVLFSEIAPRFLNSGFENVFLDCIEPRILNDQINGVSAEVMQALVQHFVKRGQLERVEFLVVKLELSSLDLNQVIPLCLRFQIFSALIHIFSQALEDFQTPAVLMLVALSGEKGSKPRVEQELLEYLKCCLLAMPYSKIRSTKKGNNVQQSFYNTSISNLERMRLNAVAFLLYSSIVSVQDLCKPWSKLVDANDPENTMNFARFYGMLQEPYPILRFLLHNINASATLKILAEALSDWDALIEDLADIMPEIVHWSCDKQKTISQATVDAVVALLYDMDEREEDAIDSNTDKKHVNYQNNTIKGSGKTECAILEFIARHVAANRASVNRNILMRVLSFLARPSIEDPNGMKSLEKENVFSDIILYFRIESMSNSVDPLNAKYLDEALHLAHSAAFHQAEAKILNARGLYLDSLQSLIKDNRFPGAPFTYIRSVLGDKKISEENKENFRFELRHVLRHLIKLDASATAELFLESYPKEDLQRTILDLSTDPDAQFKLLDEMIKFKDCLNISEIQFRPSNVLEGQCNEGALRPEDNLAAALCQLISDSKISSIYVRLLCNHRPNNVIKFLAANDSYDVDECLKYCLEGGIHDGAALLLERRGDVQGALRLHLDRVKIADRNLINIARRSLNTFSWKFDEIDVLKDENFGNESLEDSIPSKEFNESRMAMEDALSMCIRFSQDHGLTLEGQLCQSSDEMSKGSPSPIVIVWLEILRHYIDNLQELQLEMIGAPNEHSTVESLDKNSTSCKMGTQNVAALINIFTDFIKEICNNMTAYVGADTMAVALLDCYSGVSFGNFRGILLDLLKSCSYREKIANCVNRCIARDSITTLSRGYTESMKAASQNLN